MTMSTDEKKLAPWDLAAEDAMLYGTGWMVIRSNGVIEHIPPEKYLEAAEALTWSHEQISKGLPKK